MRRILFVDDDTNILQGLQRMLRPLRNEWEMAFAAGGQEALLALSQAPFDVIVTDIRMPGMDGAELLMEVVKRHPQIVRIILSGQSDQDLTLKAAGTAHQYLSKPCASDTLKNTIDRAFMLRRVLASPSLKAVVSRITSLPSIPALYIKLMEALRSPDVSIQHLGQILEKDMAMTAKVLQLINSAFFGLRRNISNAADAISYLGVDTIKALALSTKVFSQFDQSAIPEFSIDKLWKHSFLTASLAKAITKSENLPRRVIDDSFMAGLLHDVGKLILAANLPHQYGKAISFAQSQGITLWQAEQEVLRASHTEVGSYLLSLWAFPDPINEAVAFHHYPSPCFEQALTPLTAVHVANVLVHEGQDRVSGGAAPDIDLPNLVKFGLASSLPKWQALFREMVQRGDDL